MRRRGSQHPPWQMPGSYPAAVTRHSPPVALRRLGGIASQTENSPSAETSPAKAPQDHDSREETPSSHRCWATRRGRSPHPLPHSGLTADAAEGSGLAAVTASGDGGNSEGSQGHLQALTTLSPGRRHVPSRLPPSSHSQNPAAESADTGVTVRARATSTRAGWTLAA